MSRWAARGAGRFGRDRSGGVALIFGLMIPVVILATGVAVDTGRWIQAKRVTANAMDAAVLAGARRLQLFPDDDIGAIAVAQNYYSANVTQRLTLSSDTVQFKTANGNRNMTAQGAASMPTTFLRVIGVTDLPVAGGAGADFPIASVESGGKGGSNIEITMALDVTGSMCSDGVGPCSSDPKIQGLKDAAKDLINIVVAKVQTPYTSKLSLVPFSTRVRVGPNGGGASVMTAMTNLPATWSGYQSVCTQSTGSGGSETGGDWQCLNSQVQQHSNLKIMPCVTDRYSDGSGAYDYYDAAPGMAGDPSHPAKWLNAHAGNRFPQSWDSTETNSIAAGDGTGTTAADPANQWNYHSSGYCSDVHEGSQMMPLSSDKDALKARVDALVAYGSTAGPLGISMGWYTLSPNWGSVWGGESIAGSYADTTTMQASGAPVLRKVAVIMSDGVFNTLRGWKDQDLAVTANHAKALCTAMKAKNIEIYTVGLALNELPAAEQAIARDTLQSCGTDVHHFYETLNVAEMKQAFKDIAVKLTSLSLTQ